MKTKAFIRHVRFGLKPDEQVHTNLMDWAKQQILVIPKLIWAGRMYSEKEMLDIRVDFTTSEGKLKKLNKIHQELEQRKKNYISYFFLILRLKY